MQALKSGTFPLRCVESEKEEEKDLVDGAQDSKPEGRSALSLTAE